MVLQPASRYSDGHAGRAGSSSWSPVLLRLRRGGGRRRSGPSRAAAAAMAGLTRWVRPPRPWRPSKLRLEVRGAALARLQPVVVHGEAHRAAGLAPFEAGVEEDVVEALGLGLRLDHRARHDQGRDVRRHLCRPSHDCGGGAQVLDAAVGAGADEHPVDLDVPRSACPARGPCSRARARRRRACPRPSPARDRAPRRRRPSPSRGWCPR